MGWCIPIHFLFIFTHKQINMNKLPTYKAVVNAEDESGMITISLVDETENFNVFGKIFGKRFSSINLT